jgi:hypothetical protein
MGHLYEDHSLWIDSPSTDTFSISKWIERSGLAGVAKICHEKLKAMFESSINVGEVHGAAFLGSSAVRALRLATDELNDDDSPVSLIAGTTVVASSRCLAKESATLM